MILGPPESDLIALRGEEGFFSGGYTDGILGNVERDYVKVCSDSA